MPGRSTRGGSCVESEASAGAAARAKDSACQERGCSCLEEDRRRDGWREELEMSNATKGPRGEVRHHARNRSRT